MQSKQVPEHRVREAINPRTGRRERVFVNLDAVYPDYFNANVEVSFEELRAMKRGWLDKNWRTHKEPLKQISGNENMLDPERELPEEFHRKLTVKDSEPSSQQQAVDLDGKSSKSKKLKLREVRQETQTGEQQSFHSPLSSLCFTVKEHTWSRVYPFVAAYNEIHSLCEDHFVLSWKLTSAQLK